MMQEQRVLVFPRRIFDDYYSLVPWDKIQDELQEIEESYSWLDRPEAERDTDWVQPIPCAFIRDYDGRFCVLRRVKHTRKDLRGKVSLIVGGHVDGSYGQGSFGNVLLTNLTRELDEELAIVHVESLRPVGVIVDNSSITASRHIAFVHEITAQHIVPRAPEEFTNRSKLTGRFLPADQLVQLRKVMDPWSRLLVEEFIRPNGIRMEPRQRSFLDD